MTTLKRLKSIPSMQRLISVEVLLVPTQKICWGQSLTSPKRLNSIPNMPMAYYNRGVARKDSGDVPGAIADYNQAIKINPQ